jgi:hypothetical protein
MDDSYIAGFFDADGCMRAQRAGPWGALNYLVIFCNQHLETLQAIQLQLNAGNIYYNHVSAYVLSIQGRNNVVKVVNQLLPFLVSKKDQAKTMLELCDTKDQIIRDELIQKLRDLKIVQVNPILPQRIVKDHGPG